MVARTSKKAKKHDKLDDELKLLEEELKEIAKDVEAAASETKEGGKEIVEVTEVVPEAKEEVKVAPSKKKEKKSEKVKEEMEKIEVIPEEEVAELENLKPIEEELFRVESVEQSEGKEVASGSDAQPAQALQAPKKESVRSPAVREEMSAENLEKRMLEMRSIAEVEGPVFVSLSRYKEIVSMLREIGSSTGELTKLIKEMKDTRSKGIDELERCVEQLQKMEDRVETLVKIMRI